MPEPSRRELTIRLLQTSTEHLPLPRARDTAAGAGFVHRAVQVDSCPDCLANGRVLKTCETCHGRGVLESLRAKDPYDTGEGGGFIDSLHLGRHERDAELARLASQTRAPYASAADELADANENPYPWERARRRMFQDYDYRALQLALDALRIEDGAACHVVHAVYVYAVWEQPGPSVRTVAERGVRFIEQRLPDPIRAPKQTVVTVKQRAVANGRSSDRKALDARDEEVRRLLYEEHVPSRVVAVQVGLTVGQINRIARARTCQHPAGLAS